jgi:hypothetical protein
MIRLVIKQDELGFILLHIKARGAAFAAPLTVIQPDYGAVYPVLNEDFGTIFWPWCACS